MIVQPKISQEPELLSNVADKLAQRAQEDEELRNITDLDLEPATVIETIGTTIIDSKPFVHFTVPSNMRGEVFIVSSEDDVAEKELLGEDVESASD